MMVLRQARWIVFGALLVLLVFIAMNLVSLRSRIDSLDVGTTSSPVWFVNRVEYDELLLERAVNQYIAGFGGVEAVNLRFDLLWSRLVSLGEGTTAATLQEYKVDTTVAEDLLALLKANEATISAMNDQNLYDANTTRFLAELMPYNKRLRTFSLAVLGASTKQAKGWRDDVVALSKQNGLLLGLVTGAFLLGLAYLLVENLRTTKSLKEQEDLLADATAANIAKSQFISVMNHELRTPLSSIRGAVALLNAGTGGEQSPKSQRLIDIAQSNSEQLSELIQDLLDVEKFSTGTFSFDPQIVNLADFVKGELPAYTALGETYDVEFVLGNLAPGTVCNVDPVRLRQILTNLVSNAAKFSTAGMKVNISLEQPSDTIILSISDTGIGIPEDAKSSIFDAFYQVDSSNERNVGGTGLGLRIAKLIVERMGGKIWFDSEAGVGTTFYVSFPCRADMLNDAPN